ncbi:cytochrome P450 [Myxozyma melibiosi]|uniref:Cytochrome P450 n=1 Tax=Myxozyma melibiosi TaxID=54550 RepID=A0ABR1FCQ2_9ASCO
MAYEFTPSRKFKISVAGFSVYLLRRYLIKDLSLSNFFLLWALFTIAPGLWKAFYTVVLYANFLSPYRSFKHPNEKMHWIVGHLSGIHSAPPGMKHLEWMESYPEDSWIRYRGFFGLERIIPYGPAELQAILMTNSYDFVRPNETRNNLSLILGDGILAAEGDSHKRQRRLLNPAFSFGHIKGLTPIFLDKSLQLADYLSKELEEALAKKPAADSADSETKESESTDSDDKAYVLGPGEAVINVDHPIHSTTLNIIFLAGFGTKFDALANPDDPLVQAYRAVFTVPDSISTWMKAQFVLNMVFGAGVLPTKRNRDVAKAKKVVQSYCLKLIEEKHQKQKIAATFNQKASNVDKDLLNVMIEEAQEAEVKTDIKKTTPAKKGRSDAKAGLTDREILNNMMTFLAAGHETTSSATSIAIYLLTKFPEVQTKLRDELRKAVPEVFEKSLNKEKICEEVTYGRIDSIKYLNNFMHEVFRYCPPVSVTNRRADKDVQIGDVKIIKDTIIFLVPAALNRLKRVWGPDANEFNPDRWDNLPATAQNPYVNLTFLQGPRSCIGRRFAEMEFKCLLIALISRFEFKEKEPGVELKMRSVVTTKFAKPLEVVAKLV